MKLLFKVKNISRLIALIFISITTQVEAFSFLQTETNVTTSYKEFKGKVIDSKTQTPLVSAHIFLEDTNVNTITNAEGEFLLKVDKNLLDKSLVISFLGYTDKTIPLSQLNEGDNKIYLTPTTTQLADVNIESLKNAEELVKAVFQKKGENYSDDHVVMTAFYRETIKQRKKNVSLSEAIVNIYKAPYSSNDKDILKFYKTRKNTNYTRLDTLVFKLQGGPFNTLFVDMMKYPKYIFTKETMLSYNFSFSHTTKMDNMLVHVINFKQKESVKDLLYEGKLFIDYENKILTRATYSLNITSKDKAIGWFTKHKPSRAIVVPTKATYQVNYIEKNKKWYYGYSNLDLDFKVNWKNKLFNSNYSMSCEMAVTDWKTNKTQEMPKYKDRIKSSVVMTDYSIGFSDPNFWGSHNIIEPDKSIERAIKKIQKRIK
ncbi:carboxypeptidase-like regulatory domain-containing protein [Flavivirga aquimarina]|uniref:Carboxypeptidase-like regulatory domain-containing protein n=1 Tax=Flavivirga aquimarina TaxID=2027862 RepID=A0ABT8WH85_9FLAO|nr:carboxypeptidase-like regulatory domain-containing protein [Flavivirga aquimarina]MDO5972527.1 carboxypeptidase-like regulatory domain-containing protein [Flavivirga aquimarina]